MKKLLSILGLSILSLTSITNINFSKPTISHNKNILLGNKNQGHKQVKPLIDMSLKNNDQAKDYLNKFFSDKNLINKLKIELGSIIKQDGQGEFIYQSDANSIVSLDIQYSNISNIKGLEIFINLNDLDLDANPGIVDISSLSKLLNLKKLNLISDTGIIDISPLANLLNLKRLDFEDNTLVKDFSSLSKLTNLTYLSLNNFKFVDICFLSQLVNLVNLDLSWDIIPDFSPLKNLKQLTLSNTKITNPRSLIVLKSLTDLNFQYSYISDFSFLSSMTNLVTLDLIHDNISDISFLSSLTNLQSLNLSANKITNLISMSNLVELIKLDLTFNDIPNTDQAWAPLHQLPHYDPNWDSQTVRSTQNR